MLDKESYCRLFMSGQKNIFLGNSKQARFAWVAYKLLIRRKWVTQADVLEEFLGKKLDGGISSCPEYKTDLQNGFAGARDAINKTEKGSIKEEGATRSRKFCYTKKRENPDPLKDWVKEKIMDDLKHYLQFNEDNAGFIPEAWINYYLKDAKDVLDVVKEKQDSCALVIGTSMKRELTNVNLLPMLYEAIRNEKVLRILYNVKYKEPKLLTFHPHYLKEFNGRWFLFGYTNLNNS